MRTAGRMRPAAHPQMELTVLQRLVHFLGSAEFFDSQASQFLAHRNHHDFGIHWHISLPL
jgi:hypothetical protein